MSIVEIYGTNVAPVWRITADYICVSDGALEVASDKGGYPNSEIVAILPGGNWSYAKRIEQYLGADEGFSVTLTGGIDHPVVCDADWAESVEGYLRLYNRAKTGNQATAIFAPGVWLMAAARGGNCVQVPF